MDKSLKKWLRRGNPSQSSLSTTASEESPGSARQSWWDWIFNRSSSAIRSESSSFIRASPPTEDSRGQSVLSATRMGGHPDVPQFISPSPTGHLSYEIKVAESATVANLPQISNQAHTAQDMPDTYCIVNVQTSDYAALLGDSDRLELVNTHDNIDRSAEWFITHITDDKYRIQSFQQASFAGYDNRPQVGYGVLGKWAQPASVWRIRPIPGLNVYTISPLENPDIFWRSSSDGEGTPLELCSPWTARHCQWGFKPVRADAKLSPVVSWLAADGHQYITQRLLEHLPDQDQDPVGLALSMANSIREITKISGVKRQLDADERGIVSAADAFVVAYNAWNESKSTQMEGEKWANQWGSQFIKTLENEFATIYRLRNESTAGAFPDHEDEKTRIAEIFERVNEARLQFELAMGLRTFKNTYEIKEQLRTFILDRLKPSRIANHKYDLEDDGGSLRRAVCTPGTRVSILDAVITWAKDTSADSPVVYWLFGPAGSGKSTIAYTIARRFEFTGDRNSTVILGGNFFCSRQFEETKQSKRIVRTIAYHLALVCKPFGQALSDSGSFDVIDHKVEAQIEGLLVKPWQASKSARTADPSSPQCYLVIIDALDEIEGVGGSNFLGHLFGFLNKSQLKGIKFFATSRPDPELVTNVGSFEHKRLYRLQDVEKEAASNDIKTYLEVALPRVADSDLSKIVASADGLFIFAATVVRYLAGVGPLEQQGLLSGFISTTTATIPKMWEDDSSSLDLLYRQILDDAFRRLHPPVHTRRLTILHALLCTAERTSKFVVADLLCNSDERNIYIESADGVLKGLHAVLYVERDGRVLSYHKSFSDFLFTADRSGSFWCDQAVHHRRLAESCFQVMQAGLKFNIANIPSSFVLDRDNVALSADVGRTIADVLKYSCRNWSNHMCSSHLRSPDPFCSILSDFIQLPALFWIEAMNLLGFQGRCDAILRSGADWVRETDTELARKLTNAADFAVYFCGSSAASSTPHLYISALATWPNVSQPFVGWRRYFPLIPEFTSAVQAGNVMLMTVKLEAVVTAVAFSNDGSRIVSGSYDHSVWVWSASTGELLNQLDGHTDWVNSVAFSTDGSWIVSGSDDNSVRIWNTMAGELLKQLDGHTDSVNSVAFSSDGSRIVSGSHDGSVRVWNTMTGELLKQLDNHTSSVKSVAFSSHGSWIVSGSWDKSVRVWNTLTGELLNQLDGHTGWVNSVTFSNDGSRIVSGSYDESVRVWNTSTGELIKQLDGHTNGVGSVAFSSDGSRIVVGSYDGSVRVWSSSTGELLKQLDGHTGWVSSVAFSNDGSRIVSGSGDKSVRVWNASTGEMPKQLDGHTGWVNSVLFSSDGSRILSGSEDKSVRVWNASTGELLKQLDGHTNAVSSVAISSDGSRIVSGSDDESVRVWSATTGELLKHGHTDSVISVAFSSDGSRIVAGSCDESVRVWNTSTGELLKQLDGHQPHVTSVAFSSDESRIASGWAGGLVQVWNASTGELLQQLDGHTNWALSIAFSRDGSRIVSGSKDNSVRVWNTSTGELLNQLDGHTDWVRSVAFSSNGSRIVSGSDDKSVRVWNALTGELLKQLDGHTDCLNSVAFSSDGSRIVSGSRDKSVRVWDMLMIPRYLRESIQDNHGSWTYTGWLLSPLGDERLIFVPLDAKLEDSSTILTIPRTTSYVDFTHAALGLEWHKCYSP